MQLAFAYSNKRMYRSRHHPPTKVNLDYVVRLLRMMQAEDRCLLRNVVC